MARKLLCEWGISDITVCRWMCLPHDGPRVRMHQVTMFSLSSRVPVFVFVLPHEAPLVQVKATWVIQPLCTILVVMGTQDTSSKKEKKRKKAPQSGPGVTIFLTQCNIFFAQACLRLPTVKGHSKMFGFTVLEGIEVSDWKKKNPVPSFASHNQTQRLCRVDQLCGAN